MVRAGMVGYARRVMVMAPGEILDGLTGAVE